MNDPLRDRRSVADLASRGQVIEISSVIGDFSRLSDVVAADLERLAAADVPLDWRNRPVTGRLEFGAIAGDGRAAKLVGEISATLVSVCQRCLAPFEWELATAVRLLLVEAGEGVASHDGLELWELDSGEARPLDIVDEALVMAMPLAVRHAELDDCVELESGKRPDPAPAESGERMTTPFAGLAEQMGIGKKD